MIDLPVFECRRILAQPSARDRKPDLSNRLDGEFSENGNLHIKERRLYTYEFIEIYDQRLAA